MKTKFLGWMAVLALAVAICALPVYASLVATSFGFPVIVQNGSTSAFNQDTASAFDLENVNINFPVTADGVNLGPTSLSGTVTTPSGTTATGTASANVLPFGSVNLAFPNISQTSDEGQSQTATSFSQTNENSEFAYPFVGVGAVSLPSLGL